MQIRIYLGTNGLVQLTLAQVMLVQLILRDYSRSREQFIVITVTLKDSASKFYHSVLNYFPRFQILRYQVLAVNSKLICMYCSLQIQPGFNPCYISFFPKLSDFCLDQWFVTVSGLFMLPLNF